MVQKPHKDTELVVQVLPCVVIARKGYGWSQDHRLAAGFVFVASTAELGGGNTMGSFKLEKGGSIKQQTQQAGVFLFILGIPIGWLWYLPAGIGMGLLGIVLALGGTFASS